jgi:hypothetical protein
VNVTKPYGAVEEKLHTCIIFAINEGGNKTSSDLCLRNMGIARNHNSEIINL